MLACIFPLIFFLNYDLILLQQSFSYPNADNLMPAFKTLVFSDSNYLRYFKIGDLFFLILSYIWTIQF